MCGTRETRLLWDTFFIWDTFWDNWDTFYMGHVLYGTRLIRGTSCMGLVLGQRFGTRSGTRGTRLIWDTFWDNWDTWDTFWAVIGGVMGAKI